MSEPVPDDRPVARSPLESVWLLRAAYAVSFLILFLCLATPPVEPSSAGLDPSWNLALQQFALERRLVGVDYLFTYGPLSVLFIDGFSSQTFWWALLWEAAFCGLVAAEIIRLLAPPPRAAILGRLAVVAGAALALLLRPHGDIAAYLSFVVFGLVAFREPDAPFPRVLLFLTAMAALSLMKLSLLPLCLLVAGLYSYRALRRGAPLYRSPLIGFAAVWIALWLLAGQRVSNLGPFLTGAREIIGGYAQAMGTGGGDTRWLAAAAAGLAPLGGLVLFQGARATRGKDGAVLALVLLVAGVAAVAYKQGFTRADPPHLLIFFCVAAWLSLLFLLLPDYESWRSPRWLRALLALGVLWNAGASRAVSRNEVVPPWQEQLFLRNALVFFCPAESFAARKEIEEREKRRAELPQVRTRVGNAALDVWSYEQGWALLNGLRYRPRPVFQGYSAYTPALQKLNAACYSGPQAPDYVLFKHQTIDGRYPTLDDAQALFVLLERYEPVLVERECLLLQRRPAIPAQGGALPARAETALERAAPQTVRMEEWVDLRAVDRRGTLQVASAAFSDLPAGQLWRLLVRPMEVMIEVETEASGAAAQYRMIPSMSRGPFLLDPLLAGTPDVLRLLRGEVGREQRLRRFRFRHAGWPAHSETVGLKVATVPLKER